MDFIALDGSVSLSLDVSDARVDGANQTLSWPVALQPWQSGDQLMLRVREVPDCSNGTVVPNPGADPGLVADCETLLAVKDALRGTGTLNWSVDVAIAEWDGIRVEDGRVISIILVEKGLTGTVPAQLAELTGLEELRLSGNRMTGCIPPSLRDVAVNDLDDLGLADCAG